MYRSTSFTSYTSLCFIGPYQTMICQIVLFLLLQCNSYFLRMRKISLTSPTDMLISQCLAKKLCAPEICCKHNYILTTTYEINIHESGCLFEGYKITMEQLWQGKAGSVLQCCTRGRAGLFVVST